MVTDAYAPEVEDTDVYENVEPPKSTSAQIVAASRASIRESKKNTSNPASTLEVKVASYAAVPDATELDGALAEMEATWNAKYSALQAAFGPETDESGAETSPSRNQFIDQAVKAIIISDSLKAVSNKEKSVYSTIDLPLTSPTAHIETYEQIRDLAFISGLEALDRNGVEIAKDFLTTMIIPGDIHWRLNEGFTLNPIKLYKNTEEYLNRIDRWQSMTLQDRIRNIDEYLAWAKEKSNGNVIAYLQFANALFYEGKTPALSDVVLDATDIMGIGYATSVFGLKKVKKALKLDNSVEAAIRTGNTIEAGQVAVAAAAKNNKPLYGIDGWQGRAAIDPFDFSKVDEYIPVGAAGPAQATIAAEVDIQRKLLDISLEDIPRRSVLTEAQTTALAREKLIKFYLTGSPHRAEIISSDPSGIVVRTTTFDNRALTGVDRAKAEERLKDIPTAIEDVQKQLDLWDELPTEMKMTDEMVSLNDAMLNTKRTLIKEQKDLESRLNATPETTKFTPIKFVRGDYGDFSGKLDMTEWARRLASPEKKLAPLEPVLVPQMTSIDMSQAALKAKLSRAYSYVVKGLNKESRTKVDSILLQGDRDKVIYDADTLQRGIHVLDLGDVVLTEKEIGAYFKARETFNWLWKAQNAIQHRILSFNKAKYANNLDVDGVKIDGIVYPQKTFPSEIRKIYTDRLTQRSRTGSIVGPDDFADLKSRVEKGTATVVRFERPIRIVRKDPVSGATVKTNEFVNYGVINKKRISELPPVVLPHRPGYVPGMRKDVNYVVRRTIDAEVDGLKAKRDEVVAMFDKQKDAEDFVALHANDLVPNGSRIDETLTVHLSRDLMERDEAYRQNVHEAAFSGVFREERLGDGIPYGPTGIEPPRLSALEGMDRYLNHISRVYPQVEWRLGVLDKYMKRAGNWLADPTDWRSPIRAKGRDGKSLMPEQETALKDLQDWLKTVLNIPDSNEMGYSKLLVQIGRKMEKWAWMDGGRRWVMSNADRDVAQLVKSVTFHALLGFFNPRQLVVQAFGAALAFSVDPVAAPYIIRRQAFLRAVAFADPMHPGYSNAIRNVFAKAAMLKPEEAEHLADAFRRSNIAYSIRSNADYAEAQAHLPYGFHQVGKLATMGLYPFREGELFHRTYAFSQSYLKMMKKNPEWRLRKLSQYEVDEIVQNSIRLTTNMSPANQAWWQKGLMGIPTQFLAVQHRFWENMAPWLFGVKDSDWAGYRKYIFMNHAILFGTMGIPFAVWFRDPLVEFIKSPDGLNFDSESASIYAYGGATDIVFSWMVGIPSSLSEAVSIPEGLLKMVENLSDDDPISTRNMFGASWTVGNRVWDAITNNFIKYALPWKWDELTPETFSSGINDVLSITSTWRNASRVNLWKNNLAVINTTGTDTIMDLTEEQLDRLGISKGALGTRTYAEIWNEDLKDPLGNAPFWASWADDKDYKEFMEASKANLRKYTMDGLPPSGENLTKFLRNQDILYNKFNYESEKKKARKMWAEWVMKSDDQLAKNLRSIDKLILSYEGDVPEDLMRAYEANPLTDLEARQQQKELKGAK